MLKHIFNTILGIGISIITFASPQDTTRSPLKKPQQLKTIIIDAGHGLPDPGTQGKYSNESDIALAIALKLQKKMQDSMPGVKILMTRTDRNLPNGMTNKNEANRWRAKFANDNKGDLFICIHVNDGGVHYEREVVGHETEVYYTGKGRRRKKHTRSVPVYKRWAVPSSAVGAETYIWDVSVNDSKTSFVHDASSGEGGEMADSTEKYFESPEAKILAKMRTRKFFDRSKMLATLVQDQLALKGRINRGVKQRDWERIWVLQATAMPSILVETGYIGQEEDYLNSEVGQDEISSAILIATEKYQQNLQRNITTLPESLLANPNN